MRYVARGVAVLAMIASVCRFSYAENQANLIRVGHKIIASKTGTLAYAYKVMNNSASSICSLF